MTQIIKEVRLSPLTIKQLWTTGEEPETISYRRAKEGEKYMGLAHRLFSQDFTRLQIGSLDATEVLESLEIYKAFRYENGEYCYVVDAYLVLETAAGRRAKDLLDGFLLPVEGGRSETNVYPFFFQDTQKPGGTIYEGAVSVLVTHVLDCSGPQRANLSMQGRLKTHIVEAESLLTPEEAEIATSGMLGVHPLEEGKTTTMNETTTPTCCYIPCEAPAEWEVLGEKPGTHPADGYTLACTVHVGELLDDAPIHHIRAILPSNDCVRLSLSEAERLKNALMVANGTMNVLDAEGGLGQERHQWLKDAMKAIDDTLPLIATSMPT